MEAVAVVALEGFVAEHARLLLRPFVEVALLPFALDNEYFGLLITFIWV